MDADTSIYLNSYLLFRLASMCDSPHYKCSNFQGLPIGKKCNFDFEISYFKKIANCQCHTKHDPKYIIVIQYINPLLIQMD